MGVVLAFEGHCKLLDGVWLEGLAGVNARVPLLFGVVGPLWCQPGLAVGSGLCYSLYCGVGVCVEVVSGGCLPDWAWIQFVPVLEPGCLQDALCWGLVLGEELVVHRPWRL